MSALAVVVGALAGQCPPGPPPVSPLLTRIESTLTVAYSDGYLTEGTLLVPDVPSPPPCGWPLVIYVHRLGNNRVEDLGWLHTMAARGYAVWSYDVRGQGIGPTLSANAGLGTGMYSGHEKLDLAEQIAFVRGQFAGLVHADLVAVCGSSQGGVHAWSAAAFSGRTIDAPGRPSQTFPVIAAVAAYDFIPDPMDHRLRGGHLWSDWLITLIADDTSPMFDLDPAFRQQVRAAFVAQDPAPMVQAWNAEPGRMVTALLSQIDVPVFYSHAYHDLVCSPRAALDVLAALPPTTPWRAQFSTVGHNTPHNDRERALRDQLSLRWFDRFVYGVDNEVDLEEQVVAALLPVDDAVRNDPQSLWGQRFEAGAGATPPTRRLYLTDAGALATEAPTGAASSQPIQHHVAPGFDPTLWLSQQREREPTQALQSVPLSELTYATPALAVDTQLVGTPTLDLEVVPGAADFEVAALLFARVPGAADVMLTHWAAPVRGAVAGVPARVSCRLGPVATVLPAGSQLVLSLRNLWLKEPPMDRKFAAVPSFQPWTIDVQHGGVSPSFLDVAWLERLDPVLECDAIEIDRAAPAPLRFAVRGGVARAGQPYFVAGGGSGRFPGLRLPGGTLGVELDSWSDLIGQGVGTPEFVGFVGLLDALGNAAPVMDLTAYSPLDPAFAGLELTFSAWIYRSPQDISGEPTHAVRVTFR